MPQTEDVRKIGQDLWMPPDLESAKEFVAFTHRFDLSFYENLNGDLERAYKSKTLTLIEGRSVANFILQRKAERRPTACVRVSDGEGNLLPLVYDFEMGDRLKSYCVEKISYMHFGEKNIIPSAREDFAYLVSSIVLDGDLLGFPKIGTIRRGFQTPFSKLDVRALTGNRAAFTLLHRLTIRGVPTSKSVHADAWFSRGLLPYYGEILKNEKSVGLISSYPELAPKLRRSFGIQNVEYYKIPRQAIFYEHAKRKDTQHYPQGMNEVLSNLRVEFPGQVFLVAAGLLGKRYCVAIRKMGGIGIDIGSVAEIWLGIPSRGIEQSFIEKWTL